MKAVCGITLVVVSAVVWTLAARQSPDVVRFAAASVKPAVTSAVPAAPQGSPSHFYRANFTLRNLVAYAYEVPLFRVVGGPRWVGADGWEVSATTDGPVQPQETRRLVQHLLADRFGLKIRLETRDLPIYELVLARDDGRLGPNLKPAGVDCEPFLSGRQPMQEAPLDPVTKRPLCLPRFGMGSGGFGIDQRGHSMARFALAIQPEVQRVVTDRTGLTGSFDIELKYQSPMMAALTGGVFDATSPDVAALSTALGEQLGLRLRSTRGAVGVIVIDYATQPTVN